ncbi:MAG: DUF2905 domain-containing protein [Candidatus Omnitrophota bacterium]
MDTHSLGKILILLGGILIGLGIIFVLMNKIPFAGKLPGDICIQKKNFTFYFPLTTSIILSVILSLILWLWPKK